MNMRQRHLSDDRLIEVCFDQAPLAFEEQHLASCPACEGRRARLARVLTEVADVAAADADVLFTDDRLAKQRARILQRIDEEGRPGRVINFPATHPPRPALRARPGMRWIAGAAAAGLVIGVLAGHLSHDLPARAPVQSTLGSPSTPTLQAVSTTLSEEELLGQLDVANDATGGAALRPLDDLTPLVWEVAAQ